MNVKKLHMSLKISNFMIINNTVICFNSMHNLYANFVKILEICKKFSYGLVNDLGNIPRAESISPFFYYSELKRYDAQKVLSDTNNKQCFLFIHELSRMSQMFIKARQIQLLSSQISITFILDIYHVRLRYLSHPSQISVSYDLDIIENYYLYTSI